MESLRFLHIPKTAGSTFTSILRRQYSGKPLFDFGGELAADRERFEALPERERKAVALFTGHAPLVTGLKEADEATTITFLRDPISRVKSFCQHVYEGKSEYLLNDFPPESFSLDEFLESGNEELSNLQTKYLFNRTHSEFPAGIRKMSAAEARDAALDNLYNKVSHFGLQEYFDESLIVFSSALGWRMPIYTTRNRKDESRLLKFEPRHLERIAELNAIDIEVYRLAKRRFEGLLGGAAFDEAGLKRFRFVNNKLYPPVVRLREQTVGLMRRLGVIEPVKRLAGRAPRAAP
ncbi:MAG TPA: hypothetical protein VG148_05710 [Pyrinomonadaceae bacterium]|nr:hypothetical protein [Pyrinomonadaceae bacterium]